MNRNLITGFIATTLFHGIAIFAVWPVAKPHYEVIVSPSVLKVSLVSTPSTKKIKEVSLPEPILEIPEVLEIEEPDVIFEKKELEPIEEVVEEIIEEPEKIVKEEPEPIEEEVVEEIIEESEEIVKEEPEPIEEEVQINTEQGANIDAIPLTHFNKPPAYPRIARRRNWEGRVLLSVLVGREGRVVSLNVVESSGHVILDKAALTAVKQWLFEPAQLFGKPIEKRLEIPVRFRLTD